MTLPDAACLSYEQREAASLRIKTLRDIMPWPDLEWFNSAPCPRHAPDLDPLCMACGIVLRRHQRVGATWMYLGLPGLLSDTVGSGKTAQAIAVLAMYKQAGTLSLDQRAVIVCKPAALHDPWGDQLRRLAPGLRVIIADGTPPKRRRLYAGDWEVAVVSERTFAPASGAKASRPGDVDFLAGRPVDILFYDDTDAMRSVGSRTYRAICALAGQCSRVHGMHATPLQKRLMELWAFTQPVGGRKRLGSESRCRQRYVTQTRKTILVPRRGDPAGKSRERRTIWVDNGMVRNPDLVAEFRRAIAPIVLRRTAKDLDDVAMPEIQVNPVFLDLLPRQRRRYEELREGVLRRLKAGGEEVTYTVAAAAFTRGQQICGGLAALDEGPEAPGSSVKLDWVMDALTGDLAEEQVVCFVYHQGNVEALSARLRAEKIPHVLMWSRMTDKLRRKRRLDLFREGRARVLVGTTTIEASLNLQAARHMIGVDTILNPARMTQLTGRIRRQGSRYPTVFFHHLLARGTQEDGYLPLLRREQEVADIVWDEKSDIFTALTPRQLMRMIAEGRPGSAAA